MSSPSMSISELASISRLDRATVRKRLVNLQPTSVSKKLTQYDSYDALRILLDPIAKEDSFTKRIQDEEIAYSKARTRKILIEVQEREKQLVHISEVAKTVEGEYTNVRARILSLPSRCAMDLALESNPAKVKERLDQEVNEALSELTADIKYEEISNVEQSTPATEDHQSEGSETDSET